MFFKILFQNTHKYLIRIFFVVTFFLILIQGCKDTVAIFMSLENEEKIQTSNFPDNASIAGMAKIDNRYYVSTGARMFDREATSQNWGKPKLLQGYSRTSQLVQAEIDDPIYFIAYKEKNGDISEKALFTITEENGMEVLRREDKLQTLAITSKGDLFASLGAANDVYSYYHKYETESPMLLEGNASGTILDAEYFKDTTYLLTQNAFFTVDIEDGKSELEDVKIDDKVSGHMIGLLSYDDDDGTNKLVVSNKNRIWETSDGSMWTVYKDDDSPFFTDFVYIDQKAFTGLLVGTRRYNVSGRSDGYRELATGSKSFKKPSGNKYTSGALYQADVLGFFDDVEDENVFFVLTKGSGLWRGSYSNTLTIDWFLE